MELYLGVKFAGQCVHFSQIFQIMNTYYPKFQAVVTW
jgi:hypothetical protein